MSVVSDQIYDNIRQAVEQPSTRGSTKIKQIAGDIVHSPWMCSGIAFIATFLLLLVFRPPIVTNRQDLSISWVAIFIWSLIIGCGCFCLCKFM